MLLLMRTFEGILKFTWFNPTQHPERPANSGAIGRLSTKTVTGVEVLDVPFALMPV
jgi:hypothetical protein